MDFICLAAGHGTRLGHLGRYLQKCMYPVGLKPFLEHTLDQLMASGTCDPANDRLTLVVGHLAHQVRDYFGSEFRGLRIDYVEQVERRGTGHALALAFAAAPEPQTAIAWQADLFVPAALFRAVAAHTAANVVTLGPGEAGESSAIRATTAEGRVVRCWEGAGPLFDIGLWRFAPEVLATIGEVRAGSGEVRVLVNLQRSIDAGVSVGYVESDDWLHLGGTLPTAESNVRSVVRKVLEYSPVPDSESA
ncbi:MAG: NTP transferase domain-containing protein [Trueperaceae bacterium]|nr:NTP transferase domain-containing protein [Trueperaceae bacterium]